MQENNITENKFTYAAIKNAPVTYILVILNILIFLITDIKGDTGDITYMASVGAMNPFLVVEQNEWYRLFTATFLHFGIEHLVNNMLMLFVLGQLLERIIGSTKFAAIYLFSGFIASFCSFFFSYLYGKNIVSAGASGCVFGVIGALIMALIVQKGRYEGITVWKLLLMAGLVLYYGFTSSHVDNVGHVTGLIAGICLSLVIYAIPYWIKKLKNHGNKAIMQEDIISKDI